LAAFRSENDSNYNMELISSSMVSNQPSYHRKKNLAKPFP